MRVYQPLDTLTRDAETDTLLITCAAACPVDVGLWLAREGLYVGVSARFGPLEIALRPRLADLVNSLGQLRPTDRMAVMRMVGTGQANLELGLATSGDLLLRAAIVADATGHFAINLRLLPDVRAGLFAWLGVEG